MTAPAAVAEPLVLRGAVFSLLARLLGPEPEVLADDREIEALRVALDALGNREVLARFDVWRAAVPDPAAARWSRLFEQGRVAPYEMSYLRPGLGGQTARIADVSGFYCAFGFRVPQDRPDHFLAELEFAAYLAFGEARAREEHDGAGAEVFADASCSFLGDHLGGWLDLLADRADEHDPSGPYGPLVDAAARFVAAEAARRGVEPVRPERIDTPGPADFDDEDEIPSCAGCPAAPEASTPALGTSPPL